ncbi:hypothetical protein CC2G_007793 [Coprinopsis cinerea AmutBmut pab1-1]|nr:hypothetical protein CC2G_007793 [Coprinopsis cinerea AmutBmut pab1-1]
MLHRRKLWRKRCPFELPRPRDWEYRPRPNDIFKAQRNSTRTLCGEPESLEEWKRRARILLTRDRGFPSVYPCDLQVETLVPQDPGSYGAYSRLGDPFSWNPLENGQLALSGPKAHNAQPMMQYHDLPSSSFYRVYNTGTRQNDI